MHNPKPKPSKDIVRLGWIRHGRCHGLARGNMSKLPIRLGTSFFACGYFQLIGNAGIGH